MSSGGVQAGQVTSRWRVWTIPQAEQYRACAVPDLVRLADRELPEAGREEAPQASGLCQRSPGKRAKSVSFENMSASYSNAYAAS